jgi:hypothetical protein
MIRYASKSRFADPCCDNPSIRLTVNRSKFSILLTPRVLQFARTSRLTQTDALHSCDATVSRFSVIRPRNPTRRRCNAPSTGADACCAGTNFRSTPMFRGPQHLPVAQVRILCATRLHYCDRVIRITISPSFNVIMRRGSSLTSTTIENNSRAAGIG